MSFSLAQILGAIIAYLSGLFLVAHLADRNKLPTRLTNSPIVYVLSLGVFAGAMATNAIFSLAQQHGYGYLLYFVAVSLMFLITNLLLLPILRLCRVYQLASLADLLTFRFRRQWIGSAVTVAMCLTLMPMLALQIEVVADSIKILGGDAQGLLPTSNRESGLALLFCIIMIGFAVLFGTRNVENPNHNRGLVVAIAFESLVKLGALFLLMLFAVNGVFDGWSGLDQSLSSSQNRIQPLDEPLAGETARMMLLFFFAGAVCMPHMFHMLFAENTDSQHLHTASWGLPLYLLLLSLPVLPVVAAWAQLDTDMPTAYAGLAVGLSLESVGASAAAFIASLSAASAAIIVTTLALANMCLNHLVLPLKLVQIHSEQSLYSQLKWLRRILIALLILGGYGFFVVLHGQLKLAELGLVAFAGVLQFLPGLVFTCYWTGANRKGVIWGLGAGLALWAISLLLPLFTAQPPDWTLGLAQRWYGDASDTWAAASGLALAVNSFLCVAISLLTKTSEEEQIAAEICALDETQRTARHTLTVTSAAEFVEKLATSLGEQTAQAEVNRALAQLQFEVTERRPYALRRLRTRILGNLSSLVGPTAAFAIVERALPFDSRGSVYRHEDFTLLERRLEKAQGRFTGLAADLDNLRRHYRQTLDDLPVGMFSLGSDGEVLLWNRSMSNITGVDEAAIVGSLLQSLPEPWGSAFDDFLRQDSQSLTKQQLTISSTDTRWISLHKTMPMTADQDTLVLVEDISDMERLQDELLHSERLASIGRLAAGVAHEIGNPVTGIACLAQNLAYAEDPAEIRDASEDILKQTDRVTRIVESLVNFSHVGIGSETLAEPCNLADCVDEAVHLLRLNHQAREVAYNNRCDRELLVSADSQRLLQVFVNLLSNARDASPDGGHIWVDARREGQRVEISVEDQGSGIPPELIEDVLEPFVTTKEPGEGTGLGLSLVYSIVESMQGSLQIQSPVNEQGTPGTRICLWLPLGDYGSTFDL